MFGLYITKTSTERCLGHIESVLAPVTRKGPGTAPNSSDEDVNVICTLFSFCPCFSEWQLHFPLPQISFLLGARTMVSDSPLAHISHFAILPFCHSRRKGWVSRIPEKSNDWSSLGHVPASWSKLHDQRKWEQWLTTPLEPPTALGVGGWTSVQAPYVMYVAKNW